MPVISPDQHITLHTAAGVLIYQFSPGAYTSMSWTRKQRDAGTLDLAIPPAQFDRLPEIAPWVHWCSVWDGSRDLALWTGPIMKVSDNRSGLRLAVKDHASYLQRTRCPISQEWENTDPAEIAAELWAAMIELQNIRTSPAIVKPDTYGYRYDYTTTSDAKMMDQNISDLVNLGMVWTIVAGQPLFGPISYTPVTTLSEDHFVGDAITLVRDGSATFNDVLVLVKDAVAQASVNYFGQKLQTIKTIDSLSSVSNATAAAQKYVQLTGVVKTRFDLGESTTLHPNAPVTIDELVPSARFIIEARGVQQVMQLTGVQVDVAAGACTVKVTMISDDQPPELDNLQKTPDVSQDNSSSQ